jgi:hypothetical protein
MGAGVVMDNAISRTILTTLENHNTTFCAVNSTIRSHNTTLTVLIFMTTVAIVMSFAALVIAAKYLRHDQNKPCSNGSQSGDEAIPAQITATKFFGFDFGTHNIKERQYVDN